MTALTRVRAIALALAFASPAVAQETEPVLRPGDAVRVEVWRQPELSGEFLVAEDGTLLHPLYRGVVVADVALAEVRQRIHALLTRYESHPEFVIQPLLRVAIGGEVGQPSLYRLPPTTTVAEALAQAGGVLERADRDEIRLHRDGESLEVDLTDPSSGFAQKHIRSGDQIFVERRSSVFRDFVVPAASVLGAIAAIVGIVAQ